MFRIKIALIICTLLSFTLGLAGVLYWGTHQAQAQFHRSHLAHISLEAHTQLSLNALQHFENLADGDVSLEASEKSLQRLGEAIARIRLATDDEILHVRDTDEEATEEEEVERTAQLEAIIFSGLQAADQAQRLKSHAQREEAKQILTSVLKNIIEKQFKPLVDEAITDERGEAEHTRDLTMQLTSNLKMVATIIATGSSLFALLVGWALLRSLETPINALMSGTRQLARGDLTHRINLKGRNEFTYLAKHFNKMTDDLAKQRNQLLESQLELENKVAERTQELHHANQKLQHIDEVRRCFFADISHELRTPLTVIRGEAEVTLRGKDKAVEEYQTALRRIVEFAGQLAQLVDDLLFLARSASSNARFDLRPLVFNEFVTDSCKDAEVLAREKKLKVSLNITQQPLTVNGDASRLKQLLLILIDNACRYSNPNNGGTIAITLSSNDGLAVINISDQGIGIPAEDLDTVFERFYRSKEARIAVPNGTGLGLPLAKSIVEAHHGRITLRNNTETAGTTVSVELPAVNSIMD